MYKIVLKDKTVFDLKSIDEDTEKCMSIILDTDLSHDAAISNFTKDNLQYVQVMLNDKVLNTYVNIKEQAESSVKGGIITVNLNKYDTKELIINLRKENEQLKESVVVSNQKLKETIEQCNNSILEMSDMLLAMSLTQ